MRHDGWVWTRSRPTTRVRVHREETEVKEGSTAMRDLHDVKAGTRRFEGPDVYKSRAESRSKENSGEMDRQDQGRSMGV